MCDPQNFEKLLADTNSHCTAGVDADWALRAWQFRAEFWSMNYTDQSAQCIRLFDNAFNLKTREYDYKYLNWPVCLKCLCKLLGISTKRFKKWRSAWEASGRTIKRILSKHTAHVRTAPKQDIFRKYLDALAQVHRTYISTVDLC